MAPVFCLESAEVARVGQAFKVDAAVVGANEVAIFHDRGSPLSRWLLVQRTPRVCALVSLEPADAPATT